MNIKELKELIADLPDDMEVILCKDGEGNEYSPLDSAYSDAVYIPDSPWSGHAYDTNWTADDVGTDDEEWNSIKSNPRVLVLYPVN